MPIDSTTVGASTEPFVHRIDARWVMAYAAALGDLNPLSMDTSAHSPVTAHPVFPVCLEWPAILDVRHLPGSDPTTAAEAARGVHAAHDLHLHRPIVAGDSLHTVATMVGVEARSPGATQVMRLCTTDASGQPVATTWQTSISRGVAVAGDPHWVAQPPPLPPDEGTEPCEVVETIPVHAGLAHTYTECARIWNPIHTDRAVALGAGLPDIILHGTATLALAVSAVVNRCLDGDLRRVVRVGGRFSAMVALPDVLQLVITRQGRSGVRFHVLNGTGQEAITKGFVCW